MSGKGPDDLGFPQSCVELIPNSTFLTIEFLQTNPDYNLTLYQGFCFNEACSAGDFNQMIRTDEVM